LGLVTGILCISLDEARPRRIQLDFNYIVYNVMGVTNGAWTAYFFV